MFANSLSVSQGATMTLVVGMATIVVMIGISLIKMCINNNRGELLYHLSWGNNSAN